MPYVCAKGPHGAHRQDCHGFEGALTHDVIHGLDVTVPLGIGRHVPEERLRTVLHGITKPKPLKYFGVDLRGIELCADDIDLSLIHISEPTRQAEISYAVFC